MRLCRKEKATTGKLKAEARRIGSDQTATSIAKTGSGQARTLRPKGPRSQSLFYGFMVLDT